MVNACALYSDERISNPADSKIVFLIFVWTDKNKWDEVAGVSSLRKIIASTFYLPAMISASVSLTHRISVSSKIFGSRFWLAGAAFVRVRTPCSFASSRTLSKIWPNDQGVFTKNVSLGIPQILGLVIWVPEFFIPTNILIWPFNKDCFLYNGS